MRKVMLAFMMIDNGPEALPDIKVCGVDSEYYSKHTQEIRIIVRQLEDWITNNFIPEEVTQEALGNEQYNQRYPLFKKYSQRREAP